MIGKLALIGGAIAFARSAQGKKAIAQAREKYDTPENRSKVKQAVSSARGGSSSSSGAHAATT